MRISVDLGVDQPIYAQIYQQVVRGLIRGEITSGEALSPIRALADSLSVSPGTVARAYDLLAEHRLTNSNRRGGTTIARGARVTAQNLWRTELANHVKEALRSGVPPSVIRAYLHSLFARADERNTQ